MADSVGTGTAASLEITGITPAKQGTHADGKWFLIDKSGSFSINWDIKATVWVVGGGCAGTSGVWNGNSVTSAGNPIPDTGTGISYAGSGGNGGYVYKITNVHISKNVTLISDIAVAGDKDGTSFNNNGTVYNCGSGSYTKGGEGGHIETAPLGQQWADQSTAVLSEAGVDGMNTPYGYVGSSGGGGAVCNGKSNASNGVEGGIGAGNGQKHRDPGTDATNYGCGGGGGAICGFIAEGQAGGEGMQGCIIIQYTIDEDYDDPVENPKPPTVKPPDLPVEFVPTPEEEKKFVIIRNYRRIITKHDTETNNAVLSSSSCCCCTTNSGCGCNDGSQGQGSGSSELSGLGSTSTGDIAVKTQALETENLALLKRIRELENK